MSSAALFALRILAERSLAERGAGWRRGPTELDDVAESVGAAELYRERAERYLQDREGWLARLRQYACACAAVTTARDAHSRE